MTRLAVVSPCYNEQEVLCHSVERLTVLLRQMMADGLITDDSRIVLVNDGSSDRTWDVIRRLHRENTLVGGISLTRNVGHQRAIMAGMMTVRTWADAVVTIDADLQDDIGCIPLMVRHLTEGSDVVYGVKTSRQADPLLKRMTAQAFYRMQRAMGVESVYNHADFRLLSRRALDMLAQYDERNLYLRGLIPMMGLPSATVSDTISPRRDGASKYTPHRMLSLALDGITSFSAKPMYCIVYLGILFLLVSLIISIDVARALITGTAMPGWSSLILSVWLVGGFVLVSIGITGIYIGKIYTEVKHRPLYDIQEIL